MDLNQAIQMAARYANQGKFAEADKICRDIIAANDRFHPAFHLLGQLAAHAGRNDIAIPMLERAAALDPNRASYQRDLAEMMIFSAKAQDALVVLDQAIKLDPNDPKAHFFLGLASMTVGQLEKSMEAYKAALKIDPNYGPAYNNIGSLHEGAGQLKEAKNAYSKAIEIDPKNIQAQNNMASILIAEGDIEGAKGHLEKAIKVRPDYIEAHHNLSAIKKYSENDEHIAMLNTLLQNVEKLPVESQIRLHFIYGKANADMKRYDEAFDHYEKGNNLKRNTFEYDEDHVMETVDKIKSIFTAEYSKAGPSNSNDDVIPIFIVGMPRSGSSLIEQILSSHSMVDAGGELTLLGKCVKKHINEFPDDISDEKLIQIGQDYLTQVKALYPNAKFIVDKMPGNFLYAGLISKAFPGAKIINTNRNPMDCCVSNYTHLFFHTIHYTNDLGELGRYFKNYSDLMNHWRNTLSNDVLCDVSYEDVVENLEDEARKLIDFIGLNWEEDCLLFHKNKSNVRTASAAQVRKPIYKSSLDRWRVYEKHLGPLIDALEIK